MDSFFGIGASELVLILVLAGIVMGPHRIRQVAHWLGKTTAQLQGVARTFSRQLNAELDAADGSGDLRETMKEMQELRRQVADLRREVTSVVAQPFDDGRRALQDSQKAVENTIRPPRLADQLPPSPPVTNGSPTPLPRPIDVADDPES